MTAWVQDSSLAVLSLNHNESHYSPCARCPWPVNYNVTCQTIHGSTYSFYSVMKLEKLGTDVYLQTDFNTIVIRKRLWKPPGQNGQSHYSRRAFPLISLIKTITFSLYPAATIWSKPLFRAVCIALCQLIMTSLAKHFVASQTFSIMLKNLAQTCLYKLFKSMSLTSLC